MGLHCLPLCAFKSYQYTFSFWILVNMYFGKSCSSREFLASQICYFNAIRENKILAKIFGFTVFMTRFINSQYFDFYKRIIRKGLFHWTRQTWGLGYTAKPAFSGHSQRRQKLVFKTDYHIIQVKSIAECSKGSILQCFRPSFKLPFVFKTYVFFPFLSDCFRQVLLYIHHNYTTRKYTFEVCDHVKH